MVIGDIYPPWKGTLKIRPLTHQTVYVSGLEADSSVVWPRVMADDGGYDGQYRKRATQFIGNSYSSTDEVEKREGHLLIVEGHFMGIGNYI